MNGRIGSKIYDVKYIMFHRINCLMPDLIVFFLNLDKKNENNSHTFRLFSKVAIRQSSYYIIVLCVSVCVLYDPLSL